MRTPLATLIAPLLIVLLSIPLIAGRIGRNYFLIAGLAWLAGGLGVGLVALAVALLGSFTYLWTLREI